MTTINTKVQHVLRAGLSGTHTCHWPGCKTRVPPAMWGCRNHWYTLPTYIRRAIWRSYRPGQEDDKQPSAEYIAAARAALDWIASRKVAP